MSVVLSARVRVARRVASSPALPAALAEEQQPGNANDLVDFSPTCGQIGRSPLEKNKLSLSNILLVDKKDSHTLGALTRGRRRVNR